MSFLLRPRSRATRRSLAVASLLGLAFVVMLLSVAPAPVLAEPLDIAGIYEFEGETVVEGSEVRFHMEGRIVIRQNGTKCDTNVEGMFKRVVGRSGPAAFAMIGTGESILDGRRLVGQAETQTIISQVDGMDVSAPYMPRKLGPKLISKTDGVVEKDGTLTIKITSDVIGEGFTLPDGRTTTLRATRVARSPFELKKTAKSP